MFKNVDFCIAEDRPHMEPALRLLLRSLSLTCPGSHIHLFVSSPSEPFLVFATRLDLKLRLHPLPVVERGYNVKPFAFLHLMDLGCRSVVWIDSDIICTPSLQSLISTLSDGVVFIAEEMLGDHHHDGGKRTRAWGLECVRPFPFALNTGVLKVDISHRRLIEKWAQLLDSDVYQSAQKVDWHERPVHLLGDQDVLTALLGSRDFSDLPVRFLRRGTDIIQFSGPYGYTLAERLLHLTKGLPPFIHSLGHKPWLGAQGPATLFGTFVHRYQNCSPYTLAALKHVDCLVRKDWLQSDNRFDRFIRSLGFGSIPLTGIPFALVADCVRLAKYLRRSVLRA